MGLDILGLTSVHQPQCTVGVVFRAQQLIELGVDCLRITPLSTLYEKGHDPGRHSGNTCPVERMWIKDEPKRDINSNDQERRWMGG